MYQNECPTYSKWRSAYELQHVNLNQQSLLFTVFDVHFNGVGVDLVRRLFFGALPKMNCSVLCDESLYSGRFCTEDRTGNIG